MLTQLGICIYCQTMELSMLHQGRGKPWNRAGSGYQEEPLAVLKGEYFTDLSNSSRPEDTG